MSFDCEQRIYRQWDQEVHKARAAAKAAREALRLSKEAPLEPTTYINVPHLKGTILRLTEAEYRRALHRGKLWQRGERTAARNPVERDE
jgi:hypothetical protein